MECAKRPYSQPSTFNLQPLFCFPTRTGRTDAGDVAAVFLSLKFLTLNCAPSTCRTTQVVSLVAGDIASEAVFSRYWAEKTASKIILMSLDSPKLLREEPQALVQIMREFSQKRFQKAFVHVHTLTSKNAAIKVEESEEKGKKREELDTEVQEEIEVLTLFSDLRVSSVDPAAIERERDFWSKCRLIPIFIKTSKVRLNFTIKLCVKMARTISLLGYTAIISVS